MRIVIALGGNALLKRGEALTDENQRRNVQLAATQIAPLVADHEIVVTHGNGPQVGLLSLQAHAYTQVEPYPLDVLGAQTEGMIGYVLEMELGNLLPADQPLATILTLVQVDPEDPAFDNPTKFVGPVYDEEQAKLIASEKGWTMKQDGESWRRVVPSPLPKHIFEIRPIRWLLDNGAVVICAGGGGIPTAFAPGEERKLEGIEAVIDKDFASALLAKELNADLFIMATDVDGVYSAWGTPDQERLEKVTPSQIAKHSFPAGSMGPKVAAASLFTQRTGHRAAIGSLDNIAEIVTGSSGTNFVPD